MTSRSNVLDWEEEGSEEEESSEEGSEEESSEGNRSLSDSDEIPIIDAPDIREVEYSNSDESEEEEENFLRYPIPTLPNTITLPIPTLAGTALPIPTLSGTSLPSTTVAAPKPMIIPISTLRQGALPNITQPLRRGIGVEQVTNIPSSTRIQRDIIPSIPRSEIETDREYKIRSDIANSIYRKGYNINEALLYSKYVMNKEKYGVKYSDEIENILDVLL